jgi:antitoxin component YwqK of YwqJK toxin-antitoxin module
LGIGYLLGFKVLRKMMRYFIVYIWLLCPCANAQDTISDFHGNGRIAEYYTLLNGKKHGQYVTWYKNGGIKDRLFFDSGRLNGPAYVYNKKGQIVETCIYAKGLKVMEKTEMRKTSVTRYWTNSGIKVYDMRFKNGQPLACSVIKHIGDTTKVFVMPDHYPCSIGSRTVFVTNNIAYDSAGRRIRNRFRGSTMEWFENGKPHYEGHYKYGKLHGHIKEWNVSGKLKSHEVYRRGKLKRKII